MSRKGTHGLTSHQMVEQVRRIPSRRPRTAPRNRLPLRRRRRSLRRRTTPHPGHLRLSSSLRRSRIRMVQQRRALDRSFLRRPHSPPLPPHRQHTRSKQSPPALHLQALILPPRPRRAEYIILRLRHPHLPFATTPQFPRPAPPGRPTRQCRLLQAAQVALR